MDQLTAVQSERGSEGVYDTALLDALPLLSHIDLAGTPEDHRRPLFDAFRLQVRYSRPGHHATVRVTISEDTIGQLHATTARLVDDTAPPATLAAPMPSLPHVVGAPGGAPTRWGRAQPGISRRVLLLEAMFKLPEPSLPPGLASRWSRPS